MNYVPIGFKTDYSLLKSILKTSDIVEYAKEKGSNYVGILDDNPYGIMDFYEKSTGVGLKPIIGIIIKIGDNKLYFYIKDYEGYLNIIRLNEIVQDKGVTFNDLFKYNAGLICVLPYENYSLMSRLKPAFHVYLGYKNNAELERAIQISKDVLFLNEIMCISKSDIPYLKTLYKINGQNYEADDNYCLEASEFDVNTIIEFQKNINLEFDFSKRYIPKFCGSEEESIKLLESLARKGLSKRLQGTVSEKYNERLEYELDVIKSMGFVDYFLIVYDYVKFAKKNDIYVGPGRGSAAGSLVSYTLGITEIDPLKYDLLFERFLNPDRITMPDIDMDFEDVRRNEVIDYVKSKYGEKCVSLIVAYGTFGCRQAVRDVGKVMGIKPEIIDEFSKKLNSKLSLKENLSKELVEYMRANSLETVYKISLKIEGLKKNTTVHAAGVVISSIPLFELIPTFKTSEGLLTGFTMGYLEKMGLLKMDFLAIRNLNIIHNTVNIINKNEPNFSLKDIPFDDKNTYDSIFKKFNTDGVFQFDTPGMKNFLRKLQPENFEDLIAAIALFRPGPMENIDEYIARRYGKKQVDYLHPDLEPILKYTYGIIIYQEQIMQILSLMGGYTFAEADIIRRAMSKKKKAVMEEERIKFVEKSTNKGYDSLLAEKVYDLILKFANYGFNKSHSVAYAVVAYQMAYLKANYNEAFQVNTLNMNIKSEAKIKDVIEDARNKGFKVMRPSINKSSEEYVIKDGCIILPLTAIKNISSQASQVIVKNGPYDDFFDFFKKTYKKGVNRQVVETLIEAGAMDEFGKSKNTLLGNIDAAITYVELIESLDESLIMKPELEEASEPDKEYSELSIFGFYVSGHPACKYNSADITKLESVSEKLNRRRIKVVVLVDKMRVINTKQGEKMAFLEISDDTRTTSSVIIFPKKNYLIDEIVLGELYKFGCLVSMKDKEVQLLIEEMLPLDS